MVALLVSAELLVSVTVNVSCPTAANVTWKVATPPVKTRLVGNVTVVSEHVTVAVPEYVGTGWPWASRACTCKVTATPVGAVVGPAAGGGVCGWPPWAGPWVVVDPLPVVVWAGGRTAMPYCVAAAGATTLMVALLVSAELVVSVTVNVSCPTTANVAWKVATPLVKLRLAGSATVVSEHVTVAVPVYVETGWPWASMACTCTVAAMPVTTVAGPMGGGGVCGRPLGA